MTEPGVEPAERLAKAGVEPAERPDQAGVEPAERPDRTGSQIDHLNFGVADIGASATFYGAALAPLGITEIMRVPPGHDQLAMIAFGWAQVKPFFWIVDAPGAQIGPHTHLAFSAPDRPTVDAFHRAALAAGATELRSPGLQPEYHATYYGSFVRDLNGIDLEAVCHLPT